MHTRPGPGILAFILKIEVLFVFEFSVLHGIAGIDVVKHHKLVAIQKQIGIQPQKLQIAGVEEHNKEDNAAYVPVVPVKREQAESIMEILPLEIRFLLEYDSS